MNPPAVNLVPSRSRETAIVRRRIRAWVAGCAGLALALAGACILLRVAGGQEHSRLSVDGGRLAERIAAAEAALSSVRAQVHEHARRLEASRTVGLHPDWSILLSALAEQRGDDVMLQAIDLRSVDPEPAPPTARKEPGSAAGGPAAAKPAPTRRTEAYALRIRGFGLSQADVVRFVRRLEELGPLSEVQLRESRAQTFRGVPAVGFSAECRLTETRTARAGVEVAP